MENSAAKVAALKNVLGMTEKYAAKKGAK